LSFRHWLKNEELVDYLYQQQLSEKFVLEYLAQFERWLENILGLFPESGRLMPELGNNVPARSV